jgi:four helix bundle protein
MKIERFEDIKAWQEARELVRLVYKAIASDKEFSKDFRLANQIQASAVSTMANIAEGFSRKSRKEFIQFLFISKGSAAEILNATHAMNPFNATHATLHAPLPHLPPPRTSPTA